MKRSSLEETARFVLHQHAELLNNKTKYKACRTALLRWKDKPPAGKQLNVCKYFIGMTMRYAAAGGPIARKACLDTAAEFLIDGVDLPAPMAHFVATICKETAKNTKTGKRARSFYADLDRNEAICEAVMSVLSEMPAQHSSRMTTKDRTHPKGKGAAYSIVTKVLTEFGIHLSPDRVGEIYRDFKDLDYPIPPLPAIRN